MKAELSAMNVAVFLGGARRIAPCRGMLSCAGLMIEIVLNGEPKQVPSGLTVAALLLHLGVDPALVAVELNRELSRKAGWDQTIVPAGATVEIVQFVGGG